MPARSLECQVESIGMVGPGFPDWPGACEILRGKPVSEGARTQPILPPILPPAERRRTGIAVKVAIAAGHEAGERCRWPISELASVFSSSGGDGDNCHAICEVLASSDRLISPTRFHNSVHNAPSGYWSIAAHAGAASTSLCAHDASFGAGLLESLVQLRDIGKPLLYVAYDAPYPEPLRRVRPIPDAFGLAMVLSSNIDVSTKTADSSNPGDSSAIGRSPIARLSVSFSDEPADRLEDPALEAMRVAIPTARALPLLLAIARGVQSRVVLDYLDGIGPDARMCRLAVTVQPC